MGEGLRIRLLKSLSQMPAFITWPNWGKLTHLSKCQFSRLLAGMIAILSEVNAIVMRNKLNNPGKTFRTLPNTVDVP